MFIAALLIGLLTAFYFGLKPGALAGAAALALFIVAEVVSGATLWVYGVVAVGVVAVCWVGPKRADPTRVARLTRQARRAVGFVRRQLGKSSKNNDRRPRP